MTVNVNTIPSINYPFTDKQGRITPVWHEFLRSFVAASSDGTISENVNTTSVTAGAGLTGGGTGDITLNVGAGSGIAVNADTVAVDINSLNRKQCIGSDELIMSDASNNNTIKKTTVNDIIANVSFPQTAFRLIESQTASSSASLNFTNIGDYACVLFVFDNVLPATDDVEFWARTSTDNGSNYDSGVNNYNVVHLGRTGATTQAVSSTAETKILLCQAGIGLDVSNVAGEGVCGEFRLFNPAGVNYSNTTWQIGFINANGNAATYQGHSKRVTAADVDAIQFLFQSGNIASGTIYMYAMVKS